MDKGLVTVIIPVYNAEKYLDRCIQSVVNQTYKNLEIILIDDGSPDNCPEMCDVWAEKDSRIRVIHKENQGLGMARNTGIEKAAGEYICFFDSDDYVEPETIDSAYSAAKENKADMVCFGLCYENSEGEITLSFAPKSPKPAYKKEEVASEFVVGATGKNPETGEDWQIPMSACCKLYAMDCIRKNNWRFVSEREIISEDFYSVLKLYKDLESVCILPYAFYHYCENEASLTQTYRKDRFEKVCHYYREIAKLCNECGYPGEVVKRMVGTFLGGVIASLKQTMAAEMPYREKKNAIREMLNEPLLQQVLWEHRNDPENWKKRLLFCAMRNKRYRICALLAKLRNGRE